MGLRSSEVSLPLYLPPNSMAFFAASAKVSGLGRVALVNDFLLAQFIVVGLAALHLGSDVGQLGLHVHRSRIHGARWVEALRLPAWGELKGRPLRVSPRSMMALSQSTVEQVGSHPRRRGMRVGAQIADAGMDVELAVRSDANRPSKPLVPAE